MLTLSQVTSKTKKLLKILAIIFAIGLVIYMLAKAAPAIKNFISPPAPEKPNVLYGKLPKIIFPADVTNTEFTYSLNTISGGLPQFPSLIKIYQVNQAAPNLLALDNAKSSVANAGFTSAPIKINDRQYQWLFPANSSGNDMVKIMNMDIFSSNFDLGSAYSSNQYIASGTNIPTQAQAIDIAQGFLDQMLLFPSDIDIAKTATGLFSINNLQLVPATSISTAQIVRVDFFQKDLDNTPIIYSSPFGSSMSFLVGGGNLQPQVVEAHFYHYYPSKDSATYPLKSSKELFNELLQGKAHIAAYDGSLPNVTITDFYLAYYVDSNHGYFMPVAVFKGSGNFYAYLPAVSDQWASN